MIILKNYFFSISFIFIVFCFTTKSYGRQSDVQEIIKSKLEDTYLPLCINTDTIYAQSIIKEFYNYFDNKPIWEKDQYNELIRLIQAAENEGLNPYDYHLKQLKNLKPQYSILNIKEKNNQLADLDILLSDAFLTLAHHYYSGKIQTGKNNEYGRLFEKTIDLPQALSRAIVSDSLAYFLNALLPRFKEYQALKMELVNHKKTAQLFPDSIELKQQVFKILINMERWRQLPKTEKSTYIIVNIPAFTLRLYENDTVAIKMKTIVGKRSNPTPIINNKISYLVLRPSWIIPRSIINNEILPKLLNDHSYLTKNDMHLQHYLDKGDSSFIPFDSINWEGMSSDNFPYKVIQTPGPSNPLGKLKFMFPNKFNVYLHDTPAKHLFEKEQRAFSHGCIRLEDAQKLAAYIMKDDALLENKNFEELYNENERINIKPNIPIFINYWTVWPENSQLTFYKDIYSMDGYFEKSFNKKPAQF